MDRRIDATLEALRADFDATFAVPVSAPERDRIALLVLRLGAERVAVRVLEIAGLIPSRPIVAVPSRRPELLGICGIRGAIVPTYGLARVLRRPEPPDAARWLLLVGEGEGRVAFAFGGVDERLVVGVEDLRRAAGSAADHLPEAFEHAGRSTPVVSIPSVVRSITGG